MLEQNRYRYALIGGIAAAQWGFPRATYIEALLLSRRGKLDEAFIDDWLAQFAEALEKPEMLETYRQLVEKVKAM